MPRATPGRDRRAPQAGSRFLSDVLADNIRAVRAQRRLKQEDVAEGMRKLGHPWTRQTVGEVEQGRRNVTVDELLALGLVLEAAPFDLLNPIPIGGGPPQDAPPIDVGTKVPLPARWAREWLYGRVHAKVSDYPDGAHVVGWQGHLSEWTDSDGTVYREDDQ